jgi:hypothetical protein
LKSLYIQGFFGQQPWRGINEEIATEGSHWVQAEQGIFRKSLTPPFPVHTICKAAVDSRLKDSQEILP